MKDTSSCESMLAAGKARASGRGKPAGYAKGGMVHDDAAMDRKMVKAMVKPSAMKSGMKYGGKAGKK